MKNGILIFIGLILFAASAKAQDLSRYQHEVFIAAGDTLPYRILYPENYDPNQKYPLLLFLHGRGESGRDNQKQLAYAGPLFLQDSVRSRFPAIVVFPQCPANSYWANVNIQTDQTGKRHFTFVKGGDPTKAMRALLGLTDKLVKMPAVKKDQIYIGGLSMGGMGTFEMLRRKPKLFAAAFAICGGDNIANVKKYRKIPLWVFHGAKDDVVPVAKSEVVVKALEEKGAPVKFTVYPNANHNSWTPALAEPTLLPWLFSNHK